MRIVLASVILCLTSYAIARQPSTAPSLGSSSSLDDMLDALDARGQNLKSLTADVTLDEIDNQLGDEVKRSGKVWLDTSSPDSPRFHALFDRVETGGKKKVEKLEYVLDRDGKLTDRNYAKKSQTTHIVRKPGEKMNLLKLGEGPFPLPLGQPRAEVYKNFDAKKLELSKEDPPGTLHVQLIPKEGTSLSRKMKTIDIFVDPATALPVRISTTDPGEKTTRVTDLKNLQLNSSVNDADFQMEAIDDSSSWNMHDEDFNQ